MENQELTKGEKMVVLQHSQLSEETIEAWMFVKKKIAFLIDHAEFHKTDNNGREVALTQTFLEQAVHYFGKAIINK